MPKPIRTLQKNGNNYAEYLFDNPEKELNIDITIEARLYKYDLSAAAENPQKEYSNSYALENFLKQEEYIEKDSSSIQKAAQSIAGETELEIVRNIFDYVLDNMEYVKLSGRGLGAAEALRYGRGDCTEYSDLFVALCRTKKIPARVITGYAIGADSNPGRHNWTEVYLSDYGWVPFEISGADVPYLNIRNSVFSNMMPRYLYLTDIRNDQVLNNYSFCVVRYWGNKIRLTDTVKIKLLSATTYN